MKTNRRIVWWRASVASPQILSGRSHHVKYYNTFAQKRVYFWTSSPCYSPFSKSTWNEQTKCSKNYTFKFGFWRMPDVKVKLLQRLTFGSSRFAERWFNWQNLHNQPPAFIISSTLILNVISKNSSKQHVSQYFICQSKSSDRFLKLWVTLGYWLVEYGSILVLIKIIILRILKYCKSF